MNKAIQTWIGLTFISLAISTILYIFYILAYPFMNSSIDTVEKLTFLDVMSIDHVNHMKRYKYPSAFNEHIEKLEAQADKFNIDIDQELFGSLEDSKAVSNIDIEVVKSWSQKIGDDYWESEIHNVEVRFKSRNHDDVVMNFLVTDKTMFPPYSSKYLSLISYSIRGNIIKNYGQSHSEFLDSIYFGLDEINLTEEDMEKYLIKN